MTSRLTVRLTVSSPGHSTADVGDVERADAAGERAADDEGEHAVLERVDGGGGGERLVVAHGVEGAAQPERREAVVEERDQRQRGQAHPVERGQRGDAPVARARAWGCPSRRAARA